MNHLTLGKKLKVSEIGLGCMGMSEFYGTPSAESEAESIRVIHAAQDAGVNFLDTADITTHSLQR